MAVLTLTGPAIPTGVHNVVLRDAQIHSPVARSPSASAYYVIDVGVREGAYTTWIGSWSQATQKLDAAFPVSILDASRLGMRLKDGQEVVVRVTSVGSPASLVGARINFRLALVGGRDGVAKPLVAGGAAVADPNSRVALASLEKQINVGGLSEWDDPVALQDPAGITAVGYVAGMGLAVTQATNKSTGVTLSKLTGQITMNGAALAAAAEVAFTVTNTLVAATDVVVVCIASGGTTGSYFVVVSAVAAGSFDITLGNCSAGSLSQAVVINFVVIRGASS